MSGGEKRSLFGDAADANCWSRSLHPYFVHFGLESWRDADRRLHRLLDPDVALILYSMLTIFLFVCVIIVIFIVCNVLLLLFYIILFMYRHSIPPATGLY